MRQIFRRTFVWTLVLGFALCTWQSTAAEPALMETMDNIVTRFYANLDRDALGSLTSESVLGLLTGEERHVLATKYWYFDVNAPVVVSVIRNTDQAVVPFWLPEAGFVKTDLTLKNTEDWPFEVWQKEFDAGRVELGINGFDKHRTVYFVSVGPQNPGDEVEITNLFPSEAVIITKDGAWKYRDWDDLYIKDVPEELVGQKLLTTFRGRAREAHLVGAFRTTPYPSSATPDQVTLTWSEDPRTTQTVQWRTSPDVAKGVVRYGKRGATGRAEIEAEHTIIQDRLLMNDRYCSHYTAVMRGLAPATAYVYSVGAPGGAWSPEAEFTTAPDGDASFSFICFADTHYSAQWGELFADTFERHPETAFYLIAGDVVSTGLDRNEWDHVFKYTEGVSMRKPMAFALGNHDDQDGLGAWLPLALYAFPENGPDGVEPERTFSFRYGNALFLVLDVGTSPEIQAQWMERQLADTDATWKFVIYHFPLYSVEEDYTAIRKCWTPIFDKYHVDMVFHGHVHYYLRSKPMRAMEPVASPAEGTIYTISIAQQGRVYPMPPADYVEKRFNGKAVYPKVTVDGNRMTYRAYGLDGNVLDELVVEK